MIGSKPEPKSRKTLPRVKVRKRKKRLDILDLAGSGREAFKGIDVDKWLNDLRNEWDREIK